MFFLSLAAAADAAFAKDCAEIAASLGAMWETGYPAARQNVTDTLMQMYRQSEVKCEQVLTSVVSETNRQGSPDWVRR